MDALQYYRRYVPAVKEKCDPMYEHHGISTRTDYNKGAISLVRSLLSLDDTLDGDTMALDDRGNLDNFFDQLTVQHQQPQPHGTMDWSPQPFIDIGQDHYDICAVDGRSHDHNHNRQRIPTATTTPADTIHNGLPSPNSDPQPGIDAQFHAQQQQQQQQPPATPAEADIRCHLCDYRPQGDPQWHRGSLAKHIKTMHSPPRMYKCPFPGCTSAYKSRPDNLKQHQAQLGHFVEGERGGGRIGKKQAKRRKAPKKPKVSMDGKPRNGGRGRTSSKESSCSADTEPGSQ